MSRCLRRAQHGFSLVELMVAVVLGLILMAGMAQIMISGRQSFNIQSGMGKVQENGRFAMSFLLRDVRTAGQPRGTGMVPFVTSATPCKQDGTDDTCDGGGVASDVVTVQHLALVNRNNTAGNPWSANDIANSRTDCLGAAVSPNLDVAVTVSSRYFVADLDGDGVFSLYCNGYSRLTVGGAADGTPALPLADGVLSLQALYGEDTDGDTFANRYRRADQVGDWSLVVSVRLSILVDSMEDVAEEADGQTYAVLDTSIAASTLVSGNSDPRRLHRRRAFTNTIELRNRTR